jgi:diguanylate cyclase (GGDEF)-like protein
MRGDEARPEGRSQAPEESGPRPAGAAGALAVLAAAALVAAGLGASAALLLPILLLAAWPSSRLPPGRGLLGLAAVAAGPLLLAVAGVAPALRPGTYAVAGLAVLAAAAAAHRHADRLRARVREALAERDRLETVDRLTGVATRTALVRKGQRLVALARRGGRPLAVLVLDVDGLRAINERFDIGFGDEVLRSVASRLREALRATDLVGRLGEDALAVVMPDTEPAGARAAGEGDRCAVAADGLFPPGGRAAVRFTVSIGLAPLDREDADLEAPLRRADAALSAAKRAGGDRAEMAR